MLVALTCCLDRGERLRPGHDYLYVNRSYARALRRAGLTPVLVGPDADPADLAASCAALVISGGGDLPRSFSNGAEGPGSSAAVPAAAVFPSGAAPEAGAASTAQATLGYAEDAERIAWERRLLDAFAAGGQAVLGVCYGMQLINLHHGGTLHRDLRSEHPGAQDHGGSGQYTLHPTRKEAPSELLGGFPDVFATNSSHGQAVDQVAAGFRVTARAADGIIEAIESERILGVEWHPEQDETGAPLYANFARLVRRAAPKHAR